MIRFFAAIMMACSFALVVHGLAQDQAGEPDGLKKKPPAAEAPEKIIDPKKVDGKEEKAPRFEPLEPLEPIAPAKEESPEEILKRVQKNMEASEKRLDKKDVGDETRQIQGDILRDLDKLINQAENNQGGGGGKSKPSLGSSKSGQTGSQSQAQKKPGGSKQSGNDKGEQQASNSGNNKEQPGAKQDGKDKDGGGKEAGKKGDDGKQQASNKGQNGNGATGGNSPEKKEKNTVADLFTEVWGHLPATKRQEMDAYSRERFMAKYEDVLREYYRTIAERSRRGGK